jgi:predicted dehydrogenase
MNVAIIGCGLIGKKRAAHLHGCQLRACVDADLAKAGELANLHPSCLALSDWNAVIHDSSIDIVIIATPHAYLADIALAAVKAGKHVLLEKPAARTATELEPIMQAMKTSSSLVRVGFNHRYHRALRKARELIDSNALGELMFIRARYGHGGRLGYDKEWRAQPHISGGGELIDQGVHLIDLARWFLGDFTDVDGIAHTYFWNMPVDDNGFLILKTASKKIAFLHASCTEWKNLFSFEIYGKNGKLDISGLGGSYGTEKITFYKMSAALGPPETLSWEYPMADDSWEQEFAEFLADIKAKRDPAANLQDAHAALTIVQEIYRKSGYDHHP